MLKTFYIIIINNMEKNPYVTLELDESKNISKDDIKKA